MAKIEETGARGSEGVEEEIVRQKTERQQLKAEALKNPETKKLNKVKTSNSPNPNATPKGKKTRISKNADEITKRSLTRENEAAEILAKEGYEIEQNPTVEGTIRKPDYRIEGELFDCYAPGEKTLVRSIGSTIEEKVIKKQQAKRVVLNLKNWKGNKEAIIEQLTKYPIKGLEEVIAITNDGKVISIYP